MRVLILGGSGMLGHRLLQALEARGHEARATLRGTLDSYPRRGPLRRDNSIPEVELRDGTRLRQVIAGYRPDTVVNAAGLVLQREDASDPILNIELNSLLPHRAAVYCREYAARLIHISSDCVFSGSRGGYTEADIPDPVDLYGRSKLLGEVGYAPGITLRTSMIGFELNGAHGLLEWFLAQTGTVRGYRRAIFSGLTTIEMCRVIERILSHDSNRHGVYHLSAEPISKHDLLCALRDALHLPVEITPADEPAIDRSLDSSRFREEFRYNPPAWRDMIGELAAEADAYKKAT